jgi:hypothetical protein
MIDTKAINIENAAGNFGVRYLSMIHRIHETRKITLIVQ